MCVSGQRVVAVDFGWKRVGIAVADPLRLFAQPRGTYGPDESLDVLRDLDEQEGLDLVVVGWPLTPEGEEGEAVRSVQRYVERLEAHIPGVRVLKWDERFSSERAKRALFEADVPRKARRRKGRIDAAAAAILLQEYLDAAAEEGDAGSAGS